MIAPLFGWVTAPLVAMFPALVALIVGLFMIFHYGKELLRAPGNRSS